MEAWNWKGANLVLSPQRLMYWEAQKMLIVSDLHLGKTGHFRKHGLAVPTAVFKEDLHRLWQSIGFFKPSTLLMVGDFVHSHANLELEVFARWRAEWPNLNITLVKGNHDILHPSWYVAQQITVVPYLLLDGLLFVHDAADAAALQLPHQGVVSGHLHPAVVIKSGARQQLRFPCFYFTGAHCILPAFSVFTGNASIKPKKTDTIFAILPQPANQTTGPKLLKL
ncbi:MAG: ligase-associated DNA damage response endonuclease PdeM [Bacteroidetes bacterium]|nr:MAG: ligase-associated DNA damage response endonuclease PdeM [Bacteroidota bacterium]